MFGRMKPSEVFTPRRAQVNRDMYVARPDLEKKLKRALEGTQHVVVFGDSGSGKTWLYRKYFEDHGVNFKVVDLSVAVSKSLDDAFFDALPAEPWRQVSKTEEKALDTNFVIASPSESRSINFIRQDASPFESLLSSLQSTKGHSNFIVFDNFEQISRNTSVISEIASLIVRLDNPNFAKFNVRFLFVGVVADMKELIARYDQVGTINNRLIEIPEVTPLTDLEADTLLDRGFIKKLELSFEEKDYCYSRIKFITCRNAQQMHELGYNLACEAIEANCPVSQDIFNLAEKNWIESSLNQHVSQIEARMNKRDTRVQRRNQVLYCIGAVDEELYRASSVEQMVRKLFPETASVRSLGVDQILSGLAASTNPILIRNPNDSSYRLSHPKLRLAIRARLAHLAPKKKLGPQDSLSDFLLALRELSITTKAIVDAVK
jgi:AAA domain